MLDDRADEAARLDGDVVREILVEDVLGRDPAPEVGVAVAGGGGGRNEIGVPVQLPLAAWRTALTTRVPDPGTATWAAGGAGMIGFPWTSKVKHRPETWPNRPFATLGNDETAVSR